MRTPSIVWFRNDLRVADNPALVAAVRRGGPVIPLFIWAPDEEGAWPPGAASKWWLHHSLAALTRALEKIGSRLVIRIGPAKSVLLKLASQTGAIAIFWNHRYEPAIRQRDDLLRTALRAAAIEVESFNGSLLFEPCSVKNKSGKPFQVFTPFWRHCNSLPAPPAPRPAPRSLQPPSNWPDSDEIQGLLPSPDWASGLRASWRPGGIGAKQQLSSFLRRPFRHYATARDIPAEAGTSRLSPHLHFGEISPRQIWHAARRKISGAPSANKFLSELGWREFSHHLLYHFPHTETEPLRADFKRLRWRTNANCLRAWQRGQTGYPFVDAGMRELWTTGWMHNRVRMVVASFLVKDLLIDWQEGARWFWDTLVDADLAQNTLGWQWTAGCGADAAPFFRIFNPVMQGEKFDRQGQYVRRWVPELSRLPRRWIHQPHLAPPAVLGRAGVTLGKTYPHPIVSHTIAREVALEAFAKIRS